MWDWVTVVFGKATVEEVALVAIIFFCVLAYGWAPKVGEAVGALFERDEE